MDEMSDSEKLLMLLITGITNFVCFPALYVLYQKKLYFQFHIGVFTCLTSFLYHSLESVAWKSLYLSTGNWHKLDNIGSIMCFVCLMIYLMDNLQKKPNGTYISAQHCDADLHLSFLGLFITITMQTSHPWDLKNTVTPILIFVFLLIVKMIVYRKGRYNKYYMLRGMILLGLAIVCFIKGLDDRNDYLRIWHGLWHCGTGISSFFLWQIVDKDREINDPSVVKYCRQQRFNFFTVLQKILSLNFIQTINKNS